MSLPGVRLIVRACGLISFAAAVAVASVSASAAQTGYPTRPVRLIVGYPPGGSTDIGARLIAQKLAPALSQNVIVDKRSGASGMIGAGIVAKAEPDGHTLSFAASPEVAIYRALVRNPAYDSLRDFQPVVCELC